MDNGHLAIYCAYRFKNMDSSTLFNNVIRLLQLIREYAKHTMLTKDALVCSSKSIYLPLSRELFKSTFRTTFMFLLVQNCTIWYNSHSVVPKL